MKKGERRRSGRKTLANDFEHLAAEAALAPNLRYEDYVEYLCGSLERLPSAFADLDEEKRRKLQAAEPVTVAGSRPREPQIASASLPRADRKIVRSEAMANRVMAAARSRAPRVNTARARSGASAGPRGAGQQRQHRAGEERGDGTVTTSPNRILTP